NNMNNVHSAFVGGQKRRLSESECGSSKQADAPHQQTIGQEGQVQQQQQQEQPERKQRKKEQQTQDDDHEERHEHNLLDLCDELLYEIFQYLDSSSIMAMMLCSPRFESLLLDHRFWHNIDLSNAPLPLGILEEILGRATEKTHTIKICGPPSSQHVAGEFKQFTCTLTSVFPKVATHLEVLELVGVSLDFEYIHISEFPASLKSLTLKDCSVKVGDHVKSIFHTIEKHLVVLEDLSIEDNNWFEPYYIMALSKLPALRRLSLKGCQMMCKFVPYGSMAARFGFSKLEVLDLRLTPINNGDLQCFSAVETLRELLLESPPNMPQGPPLLMKSDVPSSSQPDSHKALSDDEPSTSRAAMEHLRKYAQCNAQPTTATSTDATKPPSDTFQSDNCNERKENNSEARATSRTTMRLRCLIPESDDEDTSSTSASSSDKSDNTTTQSNGHSSDASLSVQPPNLVVIALPSLDPARTAAAVAANINASANANDNAPVENPENAEAAAGPGEAAPAMPRAFIHVENNPPADYPRDPVIASLLEHVVERIQIQIHDNNPAHTGGGGMANVFLPRRHRFQPRGNFEQVVGHPMFWNVLDPLDRDYARRMRSRPQGPPMALSNYISDRAVYSFGRAENPVQPDVVWIRNSNRSPNTRLERISLRNYTHITNYTLEHLVQCSPNLVYIDVSGTGVTLLGVRMFKRQKPNCEVIATHLTVTSTEQPSTVNDTAPETETETEPETETEKQPAPDQTEEKNVENAKPEEQAQAP
ncbi:hypothetical protein KR215_003511, partial [Drosophila sulfurigaster]